MGDVFRYVFIKIFGWRYVVLIDHQGERKIRRIKFSSGRPYASWLGYHIRDVWLLDGGGLENGVYVERWEPYHVFAPKVWPTFHKA